MIPPLILLPLPVMVGSAFPFILCTLDYVLVAVLCVFAVFVMRHAWAPLTGVSEIKPHMKDFIKEDPRPYYRYEDQAEARNKYTAQQCELGYMVQAVNMVGDKCASQPYTLILPKKESDTCIVYITGSRRYFSHLESNADFDADLCGLEFPHHGRSYLMAGIDEVENEYNIVPWPVRDNEKWVNIYYHVLDNAINRLLNKGYTSLVLLGNASAGLVLQCYELDVLRSSTLSHHCAVRGLVYASPMWAPKVSQEPLLRLPAWALRTLCYFFPKLVVRRDPAIQKGVETPLDVCFREAQEHGRTCTYDPIVNVSGNAPQYIEWVHMVSEAVAFLEHTKTNGRLPALLLTSDRSEHIDIERVHKMFVKLHPMPTTGLAQQIPNASHELMLSKEQAYKEFVRAVNMFVGETTP